MLAADASSLAVEIGAGVGGAVIGGLTVWAAVAGKFGDLTARMTNVEKGLDNIDRKMDDVQTTLGRIAAQTDRRENPRA